MTTQAVSPNMKAAIDSLSPLLTPVAKEAYLFGSLPQGSAIPGESDADLLVIPKKPITLTTLYRKLQTAVDAFLDAGFPLHIILFDQARHPPDLLFTARKGTRIV